MGAYEKKKENSSVDAIFDFSQFSWFIKVLLFSSVKAHEIFNFNLPKP